MKNGKRPTKAQKKILAFYGFHPEDWLISKNTSTQNAPDISRSIGIQKSHNPHERRNAPLA